MAGCCSDWRYWLEYNTIKVVRVKFWDHNSMVWPGAENNALTIASRASLVEQELLNVQAKVKAGGHGQASEGAGLSPTAVSCDDQYKMDCQWYPPVIDHTAFSTKDAYLADLGNFTIRISHSMWAPSMPIRGNSAEMEGALMKCDEGKDCADRASWSVFKSMPKKSGSDSMLLSDILHVVTPPSGRGVKGDGLHLDVQSDACPLKCQGRNSTYRYMGVMVQGVIEYDNTGTLISGSGSDSVKYQIKFFQLPQSMFHVQVVQRGVNKKMRIIHDLFGPRFVFGAAGKVGTFQVNNLILQISTSVAMFAVSTMLVDILMCYCLAEKDRYYNTKYEESEDFAPVDAADGSHSDHVTALPYGKEMADEGSA